MQGGNRGGRLQWTRGASGGGTGKQLHYKSPLGLVFLEWGYLVVNNVGADWAPWQTPWQSPWQALPNGTSREKKSPVLLRVPRNLRPHPRGSCLLWQTGSPFRALGWHRQSLARPRLVGGWVGGGVGGSLEGSFGWGGGGVLTLFWPMRMTDFTVPSCSINPKATSSW